MWGIYLEIVFFAAPKARFTPRLADGVNVNALLTHAKRTVTRSLRFSTSVAPPSLRAAIKQPPAPNHHPHRTPSKVALLPRVCCSDITRGWPCFHSCLAPCQMQPTAHTAALLRQRVTEVRAGPGTSTAEVYSLTPRQTDVKFCLCAACLDCEVYI